LLSWLRTEAARVCVWLGACPARSRKQSLHRMPHTRQVRVLVDMRVEDDFWSSTILCLSTVKRPSGGLTSTPMLYCGMCIEYYMPDFFFTSASFFLLRSSCCSLRTACVPSSSACVGSPCCSTILSCTSMLSSSAQNRYCSWRSGCALTSRATGWRPSPASGSTRVWCSCHLH
jgi:hypothetical protein